MLITSRCSLHQDSELPLLRPPILSATYICLRGITRCFVGTGGVHREIVMHFPAVGTDAAMRPLSLDPHKANICGHEVPLATMLTVTDVRCLTILIRSKRTYLHSYMLSYLTLLLSKFDQRLRFSDAHDYKVRIGSYTEDAQDSETIQIRRSPVSLGVEAEEEG